MGFKKYVLLIAKIISIPFPQSFKHFGIRIASRLQLLDVGEEEPKAEFYINHQEMMYRNVKDPWSNFAGPRYRVLHCHYRVGISLLEDVDEFVVDIGCGLGRFTELLCATGRRVVGVDTSPTAISRAQTKYSELNFELGDARNWRPQDGSTPDAIFFMESYHRMGSQDRALALRNAHKILRPNGKIIISYGLDNYFSGVKSKSYPDIGHEIYSLFTPFQEVERRAIDPETGVENANRFYVGVKLVTKNPAL